MSVFDIALEKRFTDSAEIATIDVTSADVLLIRDSATGVLMRLPFSTLASAISTAFSSSFASLVDGKVPASQLPSYVDDVLEYANFAAFPATGETGKIYVALDTNKTYRWSGSAYIYITSGAVDSVAGKTGVVALVKADVGLSNVDNTSDVNKPVSTAQQTALDLKANKALPSWVEVSSLLNSWANVSGYATAGYFKDEFGIIHLKGAVSGGSSPPSVIFNLPSGFRPPNTIYIAVLGGTSVGGLLIYANGDVRYYFGSTSFVSLENIRFRT